MRRLSALFALLALAVAPMAVAPSPAAASNYNLTARGVWVSDDGLYNGTWTAKFDVAGFDLSGTLNLIGLPEVGQGNIHGSWDLNEIGFGILFLDKELATFDGGFDGSKFAGTFDTGLRTGKWTGSLEDLSFTTSPINTIIDGVIPSLVLSRSSGTVGQIVNLAATLHTLGANISNIENVISFDSLTTPIQALANGAPDCTVNPNINKLDTIFEFLPQGCSGNTCSQVRAVVQSLSNLQAIADGAQLYSCKVKIAKQATSGIYQLLSNAVTAVNDLLDKVDVGSLPGEVSVKRLGDCHCSTVQDSGPLPLASLAAPLLLVLVRRRSRRSADV